MWRVVNQVNDYHECRQYINRRSAVTGNLCSEPSQIRWEMFDIPRNAYRIQEDSLEYEDFVIFRLERRLVPFALKTGFGGDNCSAIVKVYGGMEIVKKGSSKIKWFLLYKRNGDVSNKSDELTIVQPHMNCQRMMNRIRIHYDYRKISPFAQQKVTCWGPSTVQLQTVNNNKRLKSPSRSEVFATESVNEKELNYFSVLPNEIIAKIFGYFDLKTLARTAQVCSHFNDIITETDNFYYNLDFQPYWNEFSAAVFDIFMDKTKNLKKLKLGWRSLHGNVIFASKLEEFLNGAKNTLTHLYIDEDSFAPKESLIKAIFACKELLELNLTCMDFPLHNNDKWFSADVIQCKNLQKLDLTLCSITYSQVIEIISKNRKLKHLILDFYDFIGPESPNMYNMLEKLVEFGINLETWSSCFALSRNLSLFQFHTNLEELDLAYCWRYKDFVPISIFNFLTKCSRLKRLSLELFRQITDEHLVTVIENCKKLEQVNIAHLDRITADSIKGFLKLENLISLNITHCFHPTISFSKIKEWRKEYPQVQIRAHHLE